MASNFSDREIQCIHAMADNDLNIVKTAKSEYLHRRTVVRHLVKVKEKTGLDPRKFHDLCKLLGMCQRKVEINLYDQEEIIEGCTVQILTNTATGDISVGWWRGSAADMP